MAHEPSVAIEDLDRAAFVQHGETLTFRELDDRANRFASVAHAAALVPGDRVLLLMPNAPQTFELLVGCARAGLVAVPVNWRLAPDEIAAVAADAGAVGVVVDRRLELLIPALLAALSPRLVLTLGTTYDAALTAAGTHPPEVPSDDRTVVLQVYTSGTSGRPKGVLLTNGNLAAKVPQVVPRWGLAADSISLLATPLFHVGALSWGLAGMYAGATTVLAGDASADTILGHFVVDRVTHTFLVPAMIAHLCDEAPAGTTYPDLKTIVYGASPISSQTQAAALDLFGPVLHQVYGMSETTGAFTEMAARPDLPAASPLYRSAGRPYPWVELEIRDPETCLPVATNGFGEVWTRSAQNTPGYWGLADETNDLLTPDGWLRTGDGGYLDDDGYLFLTDRVKDLIITGGENVYPAEVEAVLRKHADVADVAVFGIPDERWGESVAAAVVLRNGARPGPDELVAYTDGLLAGYKRPRTVVVVDDLPRNASGKVLRRTLRESITGGIPV